MSYHQFLNRDYVGFGSFEVFEAPLSIVTCDKCGDSATPLAMPGDEIFDGICPECMEENCKLTRTGIMKFWWWTCYPNCLPEDDPRGPFDTCEAAIRNARGLE